MVVVTLVLFSMVAPFDFTSFHSFVFSLSSHSIPAGGAGRDSRGRGCLGANSLDIFHENEAPSSSAMAANAIVTQLARESLLQCVVGQDEKQKSNFVLLATRKNGEEKYPHGSNLIL